MLLSIPRTDDEFTIRKKCRDTVRSARTWTSNQSTFGIARDIRDGSSLESRLPNPTHNGIPCPNDTVIQDDVDNPVDRVLKEVGYCFPSITNCSGYFSCSRLEPGSKIVKVPLHGSKQTGEECRDTIP
jgi:hypothetical protein